MQNKWVVLLAVFAISLGVILAIYIAPPSTNDGQSLHQQTQYISWYPEPRKLSDFEVTQHTGEAMTNQDLQNKWTLAFVGYTFCPDICPTTLAELNSVYPQLTEKVQDVPLQVWFLSVDPKRDTVERLNEYVNYFNTDFIATTATHDVLFPLVRSMGMMYSLSESTENPNYLVDHSASVVLINPQGYIVGRFKPKHIPGELAVSDMQQVLADMSVILGHG
ncbi:SCO family protein [Glaciecola sp. 1036]|uniref:SCO family protein n=1 Tax=Alteromonadaceae TaxID=72275 RepID=UPI003CFFCA14